MRVAEERGLGERTQSWRYQLTVWSIMASRSALNRSASICGACAAASAIVARGTNWRAWIGRSSARAVTASPLISAGVSPSSASEAFWMGLQANYDLQEARTQLGNRLTREVRIRAA